MWIYLNNAFLSIVQNHYAPDMLHVRSRRKGDIEAVFPDAEVLNTPDGDYKYRTDIERGQVADKISEQVGKIDYSNFKKSIADPERHDIYLDTWSTAHGLQENSLRSPKRTAAFSISLEDLDLD